MQIFVWAFLWEGEFDDKRARVFVTPAETDLDPRHGNFAFDAVAHRE